MHATPTPPLTFEAFSPVTPAQWEEAARQSVKGPSLESLAPVSEDGLRTPLRHAPLAELPFQAEDPDFPPKAACGLRQWPWGRSATEVAAQLAWLAQRGQKELPLSLDGLSTLELDQWGQALDQRDFAGAQVLVHGREVQDLLHWLGQRSGPYRLLVDVSSPALVEGRLPHAAWAKELAEAWRHQDAGRVGWRVSGWPLHQAGATSAQELGAWLALVVAALRQLEEAGVPVEEALARAEHELSCTPSLFESMALLRAARLLAARLAEALGLPPEQRGLRLCARGSTRGHSRTEAWTNALRVSLCGFAAMAGGADSLSLPTVADDLGQPDEKLARLAFNTQEVLREEALLDRVEDPARGSGHVEALTLALAEEAWRQFQRIEEAGGIWKALGAGRVQDWIHQAAQLRQDHLQRRRKVLVGCSRFARAQEDEASWLRGAVKAEAEVALDFAPLRPHRLAEELEGLRRRGLALRVNVSLLALGTTREHGARVDFCRDLLATAGLECQVLSLPTQVEEAARLALDTNNTVFLLCGQDDAYAQVAESFTRQLRQLEKDRARPPVLLLLAGQGGPLGERLQAAGLDGFVHARARLDEMLTPILRHLEEKP